MKKTFLYFVVFILSSVLFASDYESYQVVYERNIFTRDRTPAKEVIPPVDEPIEVDVVTGLYVLKGIAFNGPQKIIFIENEITGERMRAAVGAVLPSGVIKEIYIDKVIYQENENSRSICIGDIFCETIAKRSIL